MRPREFVLPLDSSASLPIYRQLAEGLLRAIREGRLKPGAPLPGTRDLADQCGVNRNTVLAAYRELQDEGWIESHVGSGSFVCSPLPEDSVNLQAPSVEAPSAGFDLRSHLDALSLGGPGALDLRGPWPDARLLPADVFADAYQVALDYRASEILGSREGGEATLQRALAQWLMERRGLRVDPGMMLQTRGERGALEIALRGLLGPGKAVALAFPLTPVVQTRLEVWGIQTSLLPRDSEGPRVEGLQDGSCGMVLVPPRLGPGPQVWTTPRRQALLAAARALRLPVLEMEGAWDLYDKTRPHLPLAAEDTYGVCLLAGGFEGVLAPGLNLGYLVGPSGPIQRLSKLATRLDLKGDPLLAACLARLMDNGDLIKILRRVRQTYRHRRESAVRALQTALGPLFRVEAPEFGLGLWLHLPSHLDGKAWIRSCRSRGIRLADPVEDGRSLFLGFGAYDADTFMAVARLMAEGLQGAI